MDEDLQTSEVDDCIITIIDRADVKRTFEPVIEVLTEFGLRLDRIDMLSRIEKSTANAIRYTCAEFWVRGDPRVELADLRTAFAPLADKFTVDVAIQQESQYGLQRRLFCFDMDSTLIQGEVIDELAKMAGVADRVVAITASAMRGEIEFQESFRRRVKLLEGLPEARALELLDRIPLMEGAERLFRNLKRLGAKTAIFSGGFSFFGSHLQQRLGVDHVFANELDVEPAGYVTGEVRSQIVDGARKAALLLEIAELEGIPTQQVIAVGDGANDLPMLRLAGMGVAFHAKPIVRAEAAFSISQVGLDGLLYLLGIPDWEWVK